VLTLWIIERVLVDVLSDVSEYVQPHHVDCSESRCFRPSDQWTGQAVDFLDRESRTLHQVDRLEGRKYSDPIRDEVWRIFCADNSFAQRDFCEFLKVGQNQWIGVGRWNHFKQPHISRRIKKVSPEPMPPEVFGAVCRQTGYRKTGRVSRDE